MGLDKNRWKCAKTKYDKNFVCESKCTKGNKCRTNKDFAGAGDTFETKVMGGKMCVRRTDAKGGWGMNLQMKCGKAKVVRIGNKRGKVCATRTDGKAKGKGWGMRLA